jgi:hypothetical protein
MVVLSYGRQPYYIWSDGETMNIDHHLEIPEEAINQMLYHMLLSHRREELKKRLLEGRKLLHENVGSEFYTQWEDDVLKSLIG